MGIYLEDEGKLDPQLLERYRVERESNIKNFNKLEPCYVCRKEKVKIKVSWATTYQGPQKIYLCEYENKCWNDFWNGDGGKLKYSQVNSSSLSIEAL